jgi:hypothetical protein
MTSTAFVEKLPAASADLGGPIPAVGAYSDNALEELNQMTLQALAVTYSPLIAS